MKDRKAQAIARLAVVSVLETLSFIALLAAMIAGSDGAVSVIGMTHGLLFLAYAWLLVSSRDILGWTWGYVIVAIVTGPLGAILVLERLRRERDPSPS